MTGAGAGAGADDGSAPHARPHGRGAGHFELARRGDKSCKPRTDYILLYKSPSRIFTCNTTFFHSPGPPGSQSCQRPLTNRPPGHPSRGRLSSLRVTCGAPARTHTRCPGPHLFCSLTCRRPLSARVLRACTTGRAELSARAPPVCRAPPLAGTSLLARRSLLCREGTGGRRARSRLCFSCLSVVLVPLQQASPTSEGHPRNTLQCRQLALVLCTRTTPSLSHGGLTQVVVLVVYAGSAGGGGGTGASSLTGPHRCLGQLRLFLHAALFIFLLRRNDGAWDDADYHVENSRPIITPGGARKRVQAGGPRLPAPHATPCARF